MNNTLSLNRLKLLANRHADHDGVYSDKCIDIDSAA